MATKKDKFVPAKPPMTKAEALKIIKELDKEKKRMLIRHKDELALIDQKKNLITQLIKLLESLKEKKKKKEWIDH